MTTTKTTKTTKAKTKKSITFFTVVGYSRVKGCIENNRYDDVFLTRDAAAQFIADEINDFISEYEVEHSPVKASNCKNGYEIYAYNDDDDKLDLDIVKHTIHPLCFKL